MQLEEGRMYVLRISLFDKFQVQSGDQILTSLSSGKAQDLLCYILLYRHHPRPRERLAALLWGDTSTLQSKQYLRKALWQLQTALEPQVASFNNRLLLVEPEWVQINPQADFWFDVALFERAFATVSGVMGRNLDFQQVLALLSAVSLYQGDLLDGCYREWCLCERERLQHMYMVTLDKLMEYCEAHYLYEAGLTCGNLVLRYDKVRERTHRQMMRLHYLTGDRTAALRQYEQCVTILNEELSVKPVRRTAALYQQIRTDQLSFIAPTPNQVDAPLRAPASPLPEVLERLKQLQLTVDGVQTQLKNSIWSMEQLLDSQH